jgi:hypothetical protein
LWYLTYFKVGEPFEFSTSAISEFGERLRRRCGCVRQRHEGERLLEKTQ